MADVFMLDGVSVPVTPGATLFAAAAEAGIALPSSCRQQGKCRECLVEVVRGEHALSLRTPEERCLTGGYRLACRCRISETEAGPIQARTLHRAALQIEERAVNFAPDPTETADPAVERVGSEVRLDGRRIADGAGPLLGAAIDVGTTTVVIRVVDLETGAKVAGVSFENPQRFGGSDIMARIQYDSEHPGLLQQALQTALARALRRLPIDLGRLFEVVIVGNATMRDLCFGLDVHSIGQRPYRSVTESAWREGRRPSTTLMTGARELRLPVHPAARAVGLPLVGGHVGADAAACLLAVAPHRSDRLVAIMDIGTNTEVFLGNRHRLVAASCPAGPAFEGRAIRCGMPGLDGAIARVRLDDEGRAEVQVIGGGTPEGICGSGLVDLLSELLRTARMNRHGRFESGDAEFTVDAARGIALHESDINELAQAKGANAAGLQLVAKQYGCTLADIDRLYLAGGFGRHLDVAAARRIGLIPDLPDEKIAVVGNLAIEGATIALRSRARRQELESLVASIEHVELETDPEFFDFFVAGCQFEPFGSPSPARP